VLLQRHRIDQGGLIALRPDLPVGDGVDELQRDAHGARLAADAPLQHVGGAEVARQGAHVRRLAAIRQHRGARDHLELAGAAAQRAEYLLVHAVGEEGVGRIGAQVLERQDRQAIDRRPWAGVGTSGAAGRAGQDDGEGGCDHQADDGEPGESPRRPRRRALGIRGFRDPGRGLRRRHRRGARHQVDGRLLDRSDEPVTLTRHGLEVLRRLRVVAERRPQLPHRRVEAGVEVDHGVRPQPRRELVACDQLAGPAHQGLQDLQRLFLEPDRVLAPEQLQGHAVERPAVESRDLPCGSVRHAASLPAPPAARTPVHEQVRPGSGAFHGRSLVWDRRAAFTDDRRSPCTPVSHPRSIVGSSR
jgi:hypothetical protein